METPGISADYEFSFLGLDLSAGVKFDGEKVWVEIKCKATGEKKEIELSVK